jgi:hypothetical protein
MAAVLPLQHRSGGVSRTRLETRLGRSQCVKWDRIKLCQFDKDRRHLRVGLLIRGRKRFWSGRRGCGPTCDRSGGRG